MSLAPLRPVRAGLLRPIRDGGVKHQIIKILVSQGLESLPGESADAAQVRQLEGQDGDLVARGIVGGEGLVVLLRLVGVARTDDEAVRLGLLEQLFDCLEALGYLAMGGQRVHMTT